MDIKISPDFKDRDIGVTLGVLTFCVAKVGEGGLSGLLDEAALELAPLFANTKPAELSQIAATRKAYRALGKDPGRYRPSSEALMRRIASNKGLPRINDIVDAGNVISLRTKLSLGAYDASHIEGAVTFRRAGDSEMADAIGRGSMNFEHLPVFADDKGPFGSPTSDTVRTMVTADARRILMVLIAFEAHGAMEGGLSMAAGLVASTCGARDIQTWIISNA